MSFSPVESTAALLEQLALSQNRADDVRCYYDIFRHEDGKAFFYREFVWDGHEWYLSRSEIRIGVYTYKVGEKTRFTNRNGGAREILMSLTATANVRLTQYRRRQLSSYLNEIVLILGKRKHKDFKLIIVDETLTRKPRPISKLVEYLNRFSSLLQKTHIIHFQDIFLVSLFEDEITLLRNHIRQTDGKGLTTLAILVFELGYAKRQKNLISSSDE